MSGTVDKFREWAIKEVKKKYNHEAFQGLMAFQELFKKAKFVHSYEGDTRVYWAIR